MGLIQELESREAEIQGRIRELDKLIVERAVLGDELIHLGALLLFTRKREGVLPQQHAHLEHGSIPVPANGQKKLSAGVATNTFRILNEKGPLGVSEILRSLKSKGVDVERTAVGLAIRRNPDYFEKQESGKWAIKKQVELGTGTIEEGSSAPQT